MHDFALFFITEAYSVVKVCVGVCAPLFALLLVLAGCHSGSSFLASSFGAESYPQGNSHEHTDCTAQSSFFFSLFIFSLGDYR